MNLRVRRDVYGLAAHALTVINYKIRLGRGEDYQLGQGVFMKLPSSELPRDVAGVFAILPSAWPVVDAHIEEVFFNDKEAIAEVLNAGAESFFGLKSSTFAGSKSSQSKKPTLMRAMCTQ